MRGSFFGIVAEKRKGKMFIKVKAMKMVGDGDCIIC